MKHNGSKPISIIKTKVADRRTLAEMFRSWAQALPPQSSLEVQYTYDPDSQIRGFHLLFNEMAITASFAPAKTPAEEVREEDRTRIAA